MHHIRRVGVIVAGVALLVSSVLVGRIDLSDAHNYPVNGLAATSGEPGSMPIYRNAARDGPRVGAIGISGDGVDQDDMVVADRTIRSNGDGSDHSWSVAVIVNEHFPPGVPHFEGGPLFGVQLS
jgi:hypothetical protein